MDLETVKPLIAQADVFLVAPLVELGCAFLRQQLAPENAIDIHRFASDFSKQELERASKLYILQHFHKVRRV